MPDHGTDCPCDECEPPLTSGCLPPLLGALIAAIGWCLIVSVGQGQDRVPTAVLVARTLVSEEGFDGAVSGGWASLGAVIRGHSERTGLTLRASTVALSPRLHAEPCAVVTRRWRCELDGTDRPAGLGATWTRPRGDLPSRRDAWAAALVAAASIIAGTLPDACTDRPRAWGSHEDVRRRVSAGERWIDAGCPGRNRYGRRMVRR